MHLTGMGTVWRLFEGLCDVLWSVAQRKQILLPESRILILRGRSRGQTPPRRRQVYLPYSHHRGDY